jgi:type VI secretion system secreted protein Hcp
MAFDAFLKLTGVTGDAKDSNHTGWLQLASYSFGCSNTGSAAYGGGMGTGKVSMQDFSFVPVGDSGGPDLFTKCCSGEHLGEGILELQKSAGSSKLVFYKVTFTDLLVSSYGSHGSEGQDIPSNQVTFNFAKIKMEATAQNEDGSKGKTVTGGWDVKANKKL